MVLYSVYVMTSTGDQFIRVFGPRSQVLYDIQSEIVSGHLWIEEYLAGIEKSGDKKAINHFKNAQILIKVLQVGGQTDAFGIESMHEQEFVENLGKIDKNVDKLNKLLNNRLKRRDSATFKNWETEFDEVYNNIIKEFGYMDEIYQFRIGLNYENYQNIVQKFVLLILSTLLLSFVVVIAFFVRIQKSQKLTKTLFQKLQLEFEAGQIREEKLSESEFLLTEAQRLSKVGSFKLNIINDTWVSSKVMDEIFGIEKDFERTKESWLSIIHPEDQLMMDRYINDEILTQHKSFDKKYRIINQKTLETHWVHGTGLLVFDENNQLNGMLGSIRDITEELKRNEKIEKSELRFRSLFDDASNLIIVLSPSGLIIDANKSFLKLSGYKKMELIGEHVSTIWAEEVQNQNEFTLNSILGKGERIENYSTSLSTKAGKTIDIELNAHPYYEMGELIAIRSIMTDVSNRKEFEEKLMSNERVLKEYFENSIDGIMITDPHGVIIKVNSRICEITEFNRQELMGQSIQKFHQEMFQMNRPNFLDDKKVIPKLEQMNTFGTLEMFENVNELDYITVSGIKKNIEFKIFKIPTNEGDSFGVIIRDITEKKSDKVEKEKLEIQLQQSQKLEAVGTMAGGIAHDFNNILQAIFLYIGLIQEEVEKDTVIADDVKQLLKSANRAKDLVSQILTFSKMQFQDSKPLKIQSIAKDSLKLITASSDKSITIINDFDMDCDPVMCDGTKIHQVIFNLCNNALHSMKNKTGTLILSLKKDKVEDNKIVLTISDTGTGIPDEILSKIFDPFFTTKEVNEGTGLGLSVVHGIIQEIGGEIAVKQHEDKGTSFIITLPTFKNDNHESKKELNTDKIGSGERILIIDDEIQVIDAVARLLVSKGFYIEKAQNVKEGLSKYKNKKNHFDVVVSDIEMPEMNGHELVKEILSKNSHQKIILTSGKFSVDDKKLYENNNNISFLNKPWKAIELIQAITAVIEKSAE